MMRITAAGSLPGTDFRGALSAMAEALPELLPWPELPARGPGSDFFGRALGLVPEMNFDTWAGTWRMSGGSGRAHRLAVSQWRADLDDAEELLADFDGVLKVAVAGPWTLATGVDLQRGEKILADAGALRDLSQALAQGISDLTSEFARRLPGVRLRIQVDEPSLIAVADGKVSTTSGLFRYPAVGEQELVSVLQAFGDGNVLHCCAPGDWRAIAHDSGFPTASVDAAQLVTARSFDRLGRWLSDGKELVLGVVNTAGGVRQGVDVLVNEALRVLRPLEIDPAALADQVVLATACGLAGWRQSDVTPQLEALRDAAPLVLEQLSA